MKKDAAKVIEHDKDCQLGDNWQECRACLDAMPCPLCGDKMGGQLIDDKKGEVSCTACGHVAYCY